MNKIGLVLGVTAVTALVGCLDPKYKGKKTVVTTTPEPMTAQQPLTTPVEVEPIPVEPTIEVEPIAPVPEPIQIKPATPVTPPPAVAETTTYIIQRGDTLAKISKRYNITLAAIKRENPQIKDDNKVILGQKIKLPGKIDVGEQKVPDGAIAKPAPQPVKVHTPYTGATKEYTVKSGDALSKIAKKNGCTVQQLKELNGMTSDVVRIGQKIKVPAEKVAGTSTTVTKKDPAKATVAEPKKVVDPKPEQKVESAPAKVDDATQQDEKTVEPTVAEPATAPAVSVPAAPANDEFVNYTVQEGEDITSISIQTYVSPSEIRQLNNLSDDAPLTPGMVLKLPAGSLQ